MVNDIREVLRVASSKENGPSTDAAEPGQATTEVLEAVQKKFQQWLVTSNNMKQVSALVSLEQG